MAKFARGVEPSTRVQFEDLKPETCDKDTIQSVLPATVILYDMPAFGGLNAHLAGPVSSGFCVLDKCNCGFLPPGNSCPYSCPCLDVFPIEHNSV